jgi:glycogen(starch) synthase
VEVALATMGPRPSDAQRADAAAAGVVALHESDFALEWMEDPWDDLRAAAAWLLGLAERERADAVHLNSYAHGALDWGRPVVVVGHSCVCSWWRAVYGEEAPSAWHGYRAAVFEGLTGADAVVAPTRAMAAELDRNYDVSGALAIHNGSSAPVPEAPENEPFVAGAGRVWDEGKNLGALDRAAAGLAWPVMIAGESGDRKPENAWPLGLLPRPEMERLVRHASVFAHPALYEPFGLAPLEAARSGCALVLGNIESLHELWDDAALYADPRDVRSLRAALDALIGDNGLRAEMAARARERSARYTLERMADEYARLYARLLDRSAVSA